MQKQALFENAIFKHFVMDITPVEAVKKDEDNPFEQPTLIGINFRFKPYSADELYFTSADRIVRDFPEGIRTKGVTLDMNSVIELCSVILGSISTYLYNMKDDTQKIIMESQGLKITPKTPWAPSDNYHLVARSNRHFYRNKKYGRYKLQLSIFKDGEEEIQFKFTKKDIQLLIYIIKTMIANYSKVKSVGVIGTRIDRKGTPTRKDETFYVAKIKNSLAVDQIYLHSQELIALMYVAEQLVHKQNVQDDVRQLFLQYRQIAVQRNDDKIAIFGYTDENGVYCEPELGDESKEAAEKGGSVAHTPSKAMALVLRKMNEDHQEVAISDSKRLVKLPFTPKFLAIVYLYISLDMLHYSDSHISNTPINVQHIHSPRVAAQLTKSKYRVNMYESLLTVGVKVKKGAYSMYLSGFVRDGIYSKDGLVNQYRDSDGKVHNVLMEFTLNLREYWGQFIKALSVGCTEAYKRDEAISANIVKFNVSQIEEDNVRYTYYFTLVSSRENKAAMTLTIEKVRHVREPNGEYSSVEIGVYRQPLFHRHLYQLLVSCLALGKFIKDYVYIKDIMLRNIMRYRYKGFTNSGFKEKLNDVVHYGIKKEGGKAFWGEGERLKEHNKMDELNAQDKLLLNQSSFFKLVRGEFQPFVGDKICIGADEYITDTFGEIDTHAQANENSKNKEYYPDIDWAIVLFYGTLEFDSSTAAAATATIEEVV